MIIIFYTYFIPRFNWKRKLRGFRNFIRHLIATALYYQTELKDARARIRTPPT